MGTIEADIPLDLAGLLTSLRSECKRPSQGHAVGHNHSGKPVVGNDSQSMPRPCRWPVTVARGIYEQHAGRDEVLDNEPSVALQFTYS